MSESLNFDEQRRTLIAVLRRQKIKDAAVLNAIDQVPRERFVPDALLDHAYDNHALAIGHGQTISQPYIVALMTQALQLTGVERVLEIGTGSGYQTAILCKLCQAVYTVERIPDLSERARQILSELGFVNVEFHVADGTLGWPEHAPYDRIIVTAAAPETPVRLLDQLVDGGIMVIPIGSEDHQVLTAIHKTNGQLRREPLCECRFVPLIGQEGWQVEWE
jgi:protein-L-isoaspartate(D-aspartate) O-methyltransferase